MRFVGLLTPYVTGAMFDFGILGVQKGGTTALRNQLALHHPKVCIPSEHSAHDCSARRYPCEYHGLESRAFLRAPDWGEVAAWTASSCANKTRPFVKGFDDPYLIYKADLLHGLRSVLPSLKVVVLLREPIARAFSQFTMDVAICTGVLKGQCPPHRGESIEALIDRQMQLTSRRKSKNDIIARGLYDEQLAGLSQAFPAKQIFVAVSERLFKGDGHVHNAIYAFLGVGPLPSVQRAGTNRAVANLTTLTDAAARRLRQIYANSTEALYLMLGERIYETQR